MSTTTARTSTRPAPLVLPDSLQAAASDIVLPHPSLRSRPGPAPHYPSRYLATLPPPPAVPLFPSSFSASSSSSSKDKAAGAAAAAAAAGELPCATASERLGAALGGSLAHLVAAAAFLAASAASDAAAVASLPKTVASSLFSFFSPSSRSTPPPAVSRRHLRAEALAGAQLLALAALAAPPHAAAELVGVARSVASGRKDFAASDSASAADNALTHVLVLSSSSSFEVEGKKESGVFPLPSPPARLALLALQLWSLVFLWLPLAALSPRAARGAAAAIDATFASAAGVAAREAAKEGGALARWRDGGDSGGSGGEKKATSSSSSSSSSSVALPPPPALKIPKLARDYWRPAPSQSGIRTMLLCCRADAVARALVGMASRPSAPNPIVSRGSGPWATSPADAGRRSLFAAGGAGATATTTTTAAAARRTAANAPSSSSPPSSAAAPTTFPPVFVSATATVVATPSASKGAAEQRAATNVRSTTSTTTTTTTPPRQQQQQQPLRSSSSPRAIAALMDALWSQVS